MSAPPRTMADRGPEGAAPTDGMPEVPAPLPRQAQPAEQADATRALLAAIVESTSDAVVGTNTRGTIVSWNPAAEALFGYSAEEILGRPRKVLLPPESEQELAMLTTRLPAGEHIERYESLRRRKDGRLVEVEVSASPIKADDGRLVGASTIVHDISGRKRAEAELRRSNQELEQFAYAASHDLSEPLRVIAGFVELLNERCGDALDEESERFIGFIVDGVERMQAVIDGLLAYSRAGRVELRKVLLDSELLVDEVLQSLGAMVQERGTEVHVASLPAVWAEPTLLRIVLQNLIGNAVKFTDGEPPAIRVSAERRKHCWHFHVADNGPGIEPRHAFRVFEMFQRLHGREVSGTGIGLALVQRIVARHGGEVWCAPAPDRGTTFTFTLPDPIGES